MRKLITGARKSGLSQAQVREIQCEINAYYPDILFENLLVDTYGDKDQTTSLRHLGKTDFFTREVDALLLSGACRITIHSAKDLPDPILNDLKVIAVTRGVDPADSLVLRENELFENLPRGAVIATSSLRREEAVRQLRSDLRFIDIRGTIEQRLKTLERKEADGVVIAEAALIRLGLTALNRLKLQGETVKYQGQIAIIARHEDREMAELFACLDSRIAESHTK